MPIAKVLDIMEAPGFPFFIVRVAETGFVFTMAPSPEETTVKLDASEKAHR